MPILKTADASTLTVATQLKENMEDMRSVLPNGLQAASWSSTSLPMSPGRSMRVEQESAIGALLTGLMVMLFLRDWRSVIVVVLTIPLSLMGAIIGLFITGQSINMMTLGGLSLAIGIIEGTAIVVIENIHTQLSKTRSLPQAVLVGTAETMVPILLSILCILAVFLPSFLMEGAARSLFVPLAISVGFALITAFVLSITFVPVLSIWILRAHAPSREIDLGEAGRFSYARFQHNYLKTVQVVLERRWLMLGGYVVATVVVLVLCGMQLGQELSPQVDSGQFQMRLKAPVGSRLEVTEELTRQALVETKNILGQDSLAISVGHVGQTAPTFTANAVFLWTSGPDQAVIRISLNKAKGFRTEEVQERLRKELPGKLQPWLRDHIISSYGVARSVAEQRSKQVAISFEPADAINQVMSFGSPTPVEVVISGPNQDDNRAYAEKLAAQMAKIPTLRDLQFGQAFGYPRVKVEIDRERAGLAGLTVADASNAMIAATSSSRYIIPVYWADPKSGIGYQVQLQVPPAQMDSKDQVGMIPVKQNENGAATLLRDVAKVSDSTMPQEYDRINQRRIVSITANVVGEDLGRAVRRIEAAITAVGEPPRGVKVGDDLGHLRGQVPPMRQMFSGLATGLALAVVVVFLLLTAYFQSIKLAFVSVATTPAVVAGVVFALFITNSTLNIQSFMGAIMAVGVAVANAILLVAFAEKARQSGKGAAEGARIGAEERLRAILMTSCAMIAGMVPMALALGEGGEQVAPMGRAVIGGLLVATAATLFILPAIFTVVMGRTPLGSASLHPDDPDSSVYSPEVPLPEGAGHSGH